MNGRRVVMYGRDRCGYCRRARELLTRKGVDWIEIDVELIEGAREEMQRLSGRNTVPQILVGDRALGGFDDINALDAAGELDAILANDAT
jgi:GrxC family glutaredoxin